MYRQVTALSVAQLSGWFRRAAPRLADARVLAELVRDRLGARAVADTWGQPDDRRYFQRDPARPGWVVPQPLFDLNVGASGAEDRRPGTLALREGLRVAQITYNADGVGVEWMRSSGDPVRDGTGYGVDDALLHHDQPAPLSLLCRADLDPDGEPLPGVADKIAAMDATGDVPARVWMPAPCPGGFSGLFVRTLWSLRRRAFAGELDDLDEGWLIVDGFDQTAIGGGEDFDAAWAAFEAAVAARCPVPPPNLTAAQKAEIRAAQAEMIAALPMEARDVEDVRGIPIEMAVRFVPPKIMDWPAGLPANVPAIAIPLPRKPRVPDHLQVMGFSRTLRLFGDLGEVAHGFLRVDPRGSTFVGERAAPFVVPGTFDADRRALDDGSRSGFVASFGTDAFARHAEYPWRIVDYNALSDDRRRAGPLKSGGIAHTAAWDGASLSDRSAWMIHVADRAR